MLLGLVAVVDIRETVETCLDELLGVHLLLLLFLFHCWRLGQVDGNLPDNLADLIIRDYIDLAVAYVG